MAKDTKVEKTEVPEAKKLADEMDKNNMRLVKTPKIAVFTPFSTLVNVVKCLIYLPYYYTTININQLLYTVCPEHCVTRLSFVPFQNPQPFL